MKIIRTLLLPCLFFAAMASAVMAVGTDPAGKWQWTVHGPQGPLTITAELTYQHGVLAGTVTARGNPAQISNTSFKEGVVRFTVVRGEDYQVHYQGKLEGDTLTGTMDRPGPVGRDVAPWQANRAGH